MKYLPAACASLGICGAVGYAVHITSNGVCLWGLVALVFAYAVMPE